jgi:hypothetical protein
MPYAKPLQLRVGTLRFREVVEMAAISTLLKHTDYLRIFKNKWGTNE